VTEPARAAAAAALIASARLGGELLGDLGEVAADFT